VEPAGSTGWRRCAPERPRSTGRTPCGVSSSGRFRRRVQVPWVVATGKYIGEGFDDPRLDTLFLTLPVSWRGTIAQYVGRLHRLYDGKRDVRVYDYADLDVPVLSRMFDRRCRACAAVGYSIVLPASTVPGWPNDVPLPADPQWKHDYAESIPAECRLADRL